MFERKITAHYSSDVTVSSSDVTVSCWVCSDITLGVVRVCAVQSDVKHFKL